ncbi:hypothetical protein Dimus_026298 [Dionaea muscipula]
MEHQRSKEPPPAELEEEHLPGLLTYCRLGPVVIDSFFNTPSRLPTHRKPATSSDHRQQSSSMIGHKLNTACSTIKSTPTLNRTHPHSTKNVALLTIIWLSYQDGSTHKTLKTHCPPPPEPQKVIET